MENAAGKSAPSCRQAGTALVVPGQCLFIVCHLLAFSFWAAFPRFEIKDAFCWESNQLLLGKAAAVSREG